MASSVFYRFASRKDESRVTFDGTGISIFDLKREIILAHNMSKANDFDLFVFNPASMEEYADDTTIIPRSSSVVVKRRPAVRPGKGKAAYYTAGVGGSVPVSEPNQRGGGGGGGGGASWYKGAMSKRFDGKDDAAKATPTPAPLPPAIPGATDDEEAAIAAMFQTQTANWEEAQEKLSHAAHVPLRGTGFAGRGKPRAQFAAPERPLPASYVCYRCGQKGHWIKDCPTNNDRDYDNRPRIKRTTGIPRSFLKAVENPDGATLGQGVMVTPEGGYVVAQPDLASWQKQVQRPKGLTEAEVRERPPSDASLACPIDGQLFRDAVKTPCCGTAYCEECIQTHLLERDFLCPGCGKKIPSLDKLVVDKPARARVWEYIERTIEESKKGEGEEGGENQEEGEQVRMLLPPHKQANLSRFSPKSTPGASRAASSSRWCRCSARTSRSSRRRSRRSRRRSRTRICPRRCARRRRCSSSSCRWSSRRRRRSASSRSRRRRRTWPWPPRTARRASSAARAAARRALWAARARAG
ncbi:DWNN domain-containing protein [Schizophyllum fasciatum]